MKSFYIIILFLIIFQVTLLMVSTLGIFPYGFYSDMDLEKLETYNTPQGMITYLFSPPGGLPSGFSVLGDFTIPALIGLFITIGTLISLATHSYMLISVVMLGTLFVPMVTKSYGFFNELFYKTNSQALIYLGVLFGVVILVIAIITIVELPAQGGS